MDSNYRYLNVWQNDSNSFDLTDASLDGVDYHTLTREHRAINLDTITVPSNMVVTGVRFGLHNKRLVLEVRGTEFDFSTGQLKNVDRSTWYNNLDDGQRTAINLDYVDSPIRTIDLQEPFDSAGKYVEFQQTDVKKDLAQTTVPFIESVYLEASEPRPLSGVGIYYKGESGYGGFVAIKLIVCDIGEQFSSL